MTKTGSMYQFIRCYRMSSLSRHPKGLEKYIVRYLWVGGWRTDRWYEAQFCIYFKMAAILNLTAFR